MRTGGLLLLFLSPLLVCGQDMHLAQGELYVAPGTVIEIMGPVEWTFTADAQIINDGRIEFREGAVLLELTGTPIIGSGTEHAWLEVNAPVADHAPGGLGLALTSAAAIGPLEIIRGHSPIVLENEEESVARWFSILNGEPLQLDQLEFKVDQTELNGINADQLGLFDANDPSGPWVPMLTYTNGDPLLLGVFQPAPRQYITAFHEDAALDVAQYDLSKATFKVWPTLSTDLVNLTALDQERIQLLEIFDLRGRLLPVHIQRGNGGAEMVLDISSYERGPLFLRVNGRYTFKLVKG